MLGGSLAFFIMSKKNKIEYKIQNIMFGVFFNESGPHIAPTHDKKLSLPIANLNRRRRCPYCNSPGCLKGPDFPSNAHLIQKIVIKKKKHYLVLSKCIRDQKYFLINRTKLLNTPFIQSKCNFCNSPYCDRQPILLILKSYPLSDEWLVSNNLPINPQAEYLIVSKEFCDHCKYDGILMYDLPKKQPWRVIMEFPWDRPGLLFVFSFVRQIATRYVVHPLSWSNFTRSQMQDIIDEIGDE